MWSWSRALFPGAGLYYTVCVEDNYEENFELRAGAGQKSKWLCNISCIRKHATEKHLLAFVSLE